MIHLDGRGRLDDRGRLDGHGRLDGQGHVDGRDRLDGGGRLDGRGGIDGSYFLFREKSWYRSSFLFIGPSPGAEFLNPKLLNPLAGCRLRLFHARVGMFHPNIPAAWQPCLRDKLDSRKNPLVGATPSALLKVPPPLIKRRPPL